MIRKSDRYTASAFFYAFNLNKVKLSHHGPVRNSDDTLTGMSFPAVWFKRKNGEVFVSAGYLSHTVRHPTTHTLTTEEAIEHFMENYDPRYGGTVEMKWDGEVMWAPETRWTDVVKYQAILARILDGFPNIPEGFDGWYSLK